MAVRSAFSRLFYLAVVIVCSELRLPTATAQFQLDDVVVPASSSLSLNSFDFESIVDFSRGLGGEEESQSLTSPDEFVRNFLADIESRVELEYPGLVEKKWSYYTNVTEGNRQIMVSHE